MFEKKEPFPWKIPILILTGVIVLSSGIYIGVKTRNIDQPKENTKIDQPKENTKEAFELSEDCEVWLQKKSENGSDLKEGPTMIGSIPKELLGKSEAEIVSYFKDKYPNRTIESMSKYEIVLTETPKVNDTSKADKYTIENDNGFIGLYKYDNSGNRALVEKTQIKIDSLPKVVQDEIEKGITVNTQEDAYSRLEDIVS